MSFLRICWCRRSSYPLSFKAVRAGSWQQNSKNKIQVLAMTLLHIKIRCPHFYMPSISGVRCLLSQCRKNSQRKFDFLYGFCFVCLCWGLTSQSTFFQSCRDGAIASWVINQYFRGVKCLAQGHSTAAVGFEPPTSRSGVRHSTTDPPRSPIWVLHEMNIYKQYNETIKQSQTHLTQKSVHFAVPRTGFASEMYLTCI